MKVALEVKDRNEANLLKTALSDPATRALVLVVGALLTLPTDRARRRVLTMLSDRLNEEREGERPQEKEHDDA